MSQPDKRPISELTDAELEQRFIAAAARLEPNQLAAVSTFVKSLPGRELFKTANPSK